MNIRNIDLNLFVVLEALVHERSVTRAAQRLGLSQPAVSSSLRRLRETLGDPLFVRTRGGMRPTPHAEQIYVSVSQSLNAIQSALQASTAFAAEHAQRSFVVMLSDIGEIVYLPRLIQRIQQQAPGIRLFVRRLARPRLYDELASGKIDLAIGWVDRPGDLCQDFLFKEDFVGIVRPNHPRIGKRLTQTQFDAEWHLVVGRHDAAADASMRMGDGHPERGLIRGADRRKVALSVPHFLAVPSIIANTDLVCVVPRQLARAYADFGQVRVVALPVKSDSFKVGQFWHKRFDGDQGIAWLRTMVRGLFGQ
jgi:DNA-binding transcriptional LysR family regulator